MYNVYKIAYLIIWFSFYMYFVKLDFFLKQQILNKYKCLTVKIKNNETQHLERPTDLKST